MDINQIKENKLKTILRFSIPSIIAMLLETVITITDGYWNHIWNVYPRGWKTSGVHACKYHKLYSKCNP